MKPEVLEDVAPPARKFSAGAVQVTNVQFLNAAGGGRTLWFRFHDHEPARLKRIPANAVERFGRHPQRQTIVVARWFARELREARLIE